MRAPTQALSLIRVSDWHQTRVSETILAAGLAVVCWYALFYGLGRYGILNGAEALYAESAREMLESGQFAVPTLNGVPYLEKPPLTVWLLAAALKLFGPTEFGLRSVAAGASLATILGAVRFSQLLGVQGSRLTAGLVLATSAGVIVMSRVAMPDALLACFFGLACFSFAAAMHRSSRGLARLAAALLGIGALAKGLVVIALFALIVAAFWAIERRERTRIERLVRDPVTALLVVVPLAAWLFAAESARPGTLAFWILDEQVLRFLGRLEPHDYYSGSVFYYVPRLFLLLFPWAGALAFGWWISRREPASPGLSTPLRRFLWLCLWVPFGFFSASQAKANYYLVICVPALAMLTAEYLPALVRYPRRWPLMAAIALSALPAAAMVALWWWRVSAGETPSDFLDARNAAPFLIAAIVVLGGAGALLAHNGSRLAALACLAALAIPMQAEIGQLAREANRYVSARPMARFIHSEFRGRPVFLYQDFEAFGSLPFYLGHAVPVIDTRSSDLYHGRRLDPYSPSFPTEEDVLNFAPAAVIVVMKSREEAFAQSSLAPRAKRVKTIGWASLYELGGQRNAIETPRAPDRPLFAAAAR